jgi:hypothetical protein
LAICLALRGCTSGCSTAADHARDSQARPDAGSYTPVTILIDERQDGVRLSYDRTASLAAPYENTEALKVAKDLDARVEALLASANT